MKKIIQNLLAKFGYTIAKVPIKRNPAKDITVHLGNTNIIMPGINPIIDSYKYIKSYNMEFIRILKAISDKYPYFSAIDVGANVGDTLALIRSVGNIPTLCIEGDDLSFKYLTINSKQFTDVTILKQYLGEVNESIKMRTEKKGWNNTLIPDNKQSDIIDLCTLDTVLNTHSKFYSETRFLKIDTEGFDTIILRGAVNFLKAQKPVIYFEYNKANMKALKEDGFQTLINLYQFGYNHVLIFDDKGRFLINVGLSDQQQLKALDSYADGNNGLISYYNIAIFSAADNDIAVQLCVSEIEFNTI